VSDNLEEEGEDDNRQDQEDAILFMMQSEELLSPSDFRQGFRNIMAYGVYSVPLHLRLCYYRAVLRVIFEQNHNWTWKQNRLSEIARLARNNIFICQQEANNDDTIRDFCKYCIEALQQRRNTREIGDQRYSGGSMLLIFMKN
jgi:hypothetical protein